MPWTVRIASGLLMVCLACAFVMSDEPPVKQDASPVGKKAEAKKAEAKRSDKAGQKKAEVPAGYEDAPEAGERPPAREAAAVNVEIVMEALEEGGVAQVLALDVDAQVANLEKQLMPQFTPLMMAELSFINRACDLKLEQRKKIKAVSDQCLQGAARKYALAQHGMQRGVRQQVVPDPTDLLHQALAKVLQETLRPEQKTAYDDEMATRKAHRKRVAVENVVAMIDARIVLTIDQRQKLTESLDKNWQSQWVQSIEMMINNNQYLPNIPDQFVMPTLNETQKQVWRTIPKNNYAVWGGFGWGNQGGAVDDFPLVEAEADVEKTSAN